MERDGAEVARFGNTEAVVAWTRDQFALSPNLPDRQKKKIAKKFQEWDTNPERVVSLYLSIFNDCREHIRHVMQTSHLPTFSYEALRDSDMYRKMVFWGTLYDLAHYKLTYNGKRYCDISECDLYSYESVQSRVEQALCDSGLNYSSLSSIKKLAVVNEYAPFAFSHEVHKKKRKG